MFAFKACASRRNPNVGLALIGSSFAIQMVFLRTWARVLGVSEEVALAGIAAVYLVLVAFVLSRGRRDRS